MGVLLPTRSLHRYRARHEKGRRECLCLLWVRSGKALTEQMSSGSPPKADVGRRGWHIRLGPGTDLCESISPTRAGRAWSENRSTCPEDPRRSPTAAALLLRGIVRSALRAADQNIVDLVRFGMHQDGATFAAGIVDCMRADDQDRRSAHGRAKSAFRN